MNGTMRLAAGLFVTVPTQKWVTVACLALAAPALLWRNHGTTVLAVIALAILTLTQSMVAGAALRQIASARAFRLRPRGPLVLWTATTLALFATVVPSVAVFLAANAVLRAPVTDPVVALATAAGLLMLVWTVAFVISGHPMACGLLAVLVTQVPRWDVPDLAVPLLPAAAATGALAWAGVGMRLAARRRIRAGWRLTPSEDPASSAIWAWLASRSHEPAGTPTRRMGVRAWLLGSPSLVPAAGVGVFAGLLLTAMMGLGDRADASVREIDAVMRMLAVLAVAISPYAYPTMARARMLWLRSGLDREALYREVERSAFVQVAVVFAGAAVPTLALVAWRGGGAPELRSMMVLATGFGVTACLIWYQLLLVRGWTVPAVLGAIGLALTCIGALMISAGLGGTAGALRIALWVVVAALALCFRMAGPPRWRTIDWLRLKVPRPAIRRA